MKTIRILEKEISMELYDAKSMPPSNNPDCREAQERYAKGERFFTDRKSVV